MLFRSENKPKGETNPYQILGWAYDGNPIFGPYGKIKGQIERLRSSYARKTSNEIQELVNQKLRPNFNNGFFIDDYKFDLAKSGGDLDACNGMFISDKDFPNIHYGYFFTIDEQGNPEYPYVVGTSFKDTPIKENYEPLHNQDKDLNELNLLRNTGPYYLNSEIGRAHV